MTKTRHRTIIDVHLILTQAGRVLLAQRQGTGYADGQWHMPSGHLEDGEAARDGLAREVKEEIGIVVQPADMRLVHTLHRGHPTEEPRLGLFFTASLWQGEVTNCEPHKCGALEWFPLDDLPADMVPYPRAGLEGALEHQPYAEIGW